MATYHVYTLADAAALARSDENSLLDSKWDFEDGRQTYWTLWETPQGERYIHLALITEHENGSGYWVKMMDEFVGPLFYSVPVEWFALATDDKIPAVLRGHSDGNPQVLAYRKNWRAEALRRAPRVPA